MKNDDAMKSVVLKSAKRVSQTIENAVISCKFALCFKVVNDNHDFLSKFTNFSDSAKEITLLINNYSSLETEFVQNFKKDVLNNNKLSEKRDYINQRSRLHDAFVHLNEQILGCPTELKHIIDSFSEKEEVLNLLSSHQVIFDFLEEIQHFYVKTLSLTLEEKEAIESELRLKNEKINALKKEKEVALKAFNSQQIKQKKELVELQERRLNIQSNLKAARESEKCEKEQIDRDVEKRKKQSELKHQSTMQELLIRKNDLEIKLRETSKKNKVIELNSLREKENLESDYAQLIEMHHRLKEEKKSNIDKELTWAKAEKTELDDLQAHFDLVDKNIKIGLNEEEKLKRIKDMELEVKKILDFSATYLQKLFRGRRDRALVAKLKQKKNPKGKTKGKKKGKK